MRFAGKKCFKTFANANMNDLHWKIGMQASCQLNAARKLKKLKVF